MHHDRFVRRDGDAQRRHQRLPVDRHQQAEPTGRRWVMEHLGPNDSWLGTEGLRFNDLAAGEALATVADPKAFATVLGSSDLRLANCDFHGLDLSGADLAYSYLRKANLSGCDLSNADLSHANLRGADLTHANLTGANLTKAKMDGAKIFGAILPDGNSSD